MSPRLAESHTPAAGHTHLLWPPLVCAVPRNSCANGSWQAEAHGPEAARRCPPAKAGEQQSGPCAARSLQSGATCRRRHSCGDLQTGPPEQGHMQHSGAHLRGSVYLYHCAAHIWCCPTPVVMMASPLVSSQRTCRQAAVRHWHSSSNASEQYTCVLTQLHFPSSAGLCMLRKPNSLPSTSGQCCNLAKGGRPTLL